MLPIGAGKDECLTILHLPLVRHLSVRVAHDPRYVRSRWEVDANPRCCAEPVML